MPANVVDVALARWSAEFADQGIFTTDEHLILTSWNKWLQDHSGRLSADVVGRHLLTAFPDLSTRGLDEHYRNALSGQAYLLSHKLHGHLMAFSSRAVEGRSMTMRQSARIAPLIAADSVVGTITVIDDVTERVTTENVLRQQQELLEQRVEERTRALALEVAERRAAESRIRNLMRRLLTTQEEERRRIARDLHDHTGQHMTALHLKLAMLGRMGAREADWQAALKETQGYLQQLDRELDSFTADLKLGGIYTLGVVPAIADQVTHWSKTYGIAAHFDAIGFNDARLDAEIETTLYRITQEVLTNVAKHARASAVNVVIQRRGHDVVLSIEDDGVGFDAESIATTGRDGGMGLIGIRERASLLGGDAQFESAPGRGTTVIVTIRASH